MQNVLFINGHLNTGGVERSLVDILRHMDDTKYTVDVLLLEEKGDYLEELPPEVSVLFLDIHDTYGSFLSSLRRCITHQNWMCLRLRLLFLLRKWIGERALKSAAKILLGKYHYDCVIPVSALTWQHIPFRQNEKLHGGITASSMLTRRHTPTCAGEWMRLRLCRKHVKKC